MIRLIEGLPLRWKFVLGTTFVVLLLAFCLGAVTRVVFQGTLEAELGERALAVASALRASTADAVLTGDRAGLSLVLEATRVADPAVAYAVITDGSGRVVAQDLGDGLPAGFEGAIARLNVTDEKPVWMESDRSLVRHVSVEVVPGSGFRLAIGLRASTVTVILDRLTFLFPLVTGLALVTCLSFAVWLGAYLSNPLRAIARASEAVSRGDLTVSLEIHGRDEVGQLARSFDAMLRELRAARDEAARTTERLIQTEKMSALGTFVAGMAHQVNNPLGGISTCLDMLDRTDDPARRAEYMALARKAAARLREVISRLLSHSRATGAMIGPLDLNEVVREALSLVEPEARRSGLRVTVSVEPGGCPIRGDGHALADAFVNLFMNAVDATPTGGEIRVTTRRLSEGSELSVEDSGPGVPVQARPHVFEPFFTTKTNGTGLGLYVVYLAADRHGGDARVAESGLGGALFTLFLPATGP